MERTPVMLDGNAVGTLTAAEEGLYVCYRAEYRLPSPQVLRLVAVGNQGELRLGVPEPRSGVFRLTRRLSARESEQAGRLLRGELRWTGEEEEAARWQPAADPRLLFRSAFLREQLRGCQGALTRQEEGLRYLALPFDRRRPFLLTSLFCFARVRRIGGQEYAVFCFDRGENPVFR